MGITPIVKIINKSGIIHSIGDGLLVSFFFKNKPSLSIRYSSPYEFRENLNFERKFLPYRHMRSSSQTIPLAA